MSNETNLMSKYFDCVEVTRPTGPTSALEELESDLSDINGVIELVEYLTINALKIGGMDRKTQEFDLICNNHAPELIGMVDRRNKINSQISKLKDTQGGDNEQY